MKRQHNCSERVSPITCLESLIEAAQQREWQNAQERKRGAHLLERRPPTWQRGHSERHLLN